MCALRTDVQVGDEILFGLRVKGCGEDAANWILQNRPFESYEHMLEVINEKTKQHKKIPDNSIVYGNPAKIIRALRDDEIEALRESALAHAELARAYKAEVL